MIGHVKTLSEKLLSQIYSRFQWLCISMAFLKHPTAEEQSKYIRRTTKINRREKKENAITELSMIASAIMIEINEIKYFEIDDILGKNLKRIYCVPFG